MQAVALLARQLDRIKIKITKKFFLIFLSFQNIYIFLKKRVTDTERRKKKEKRTKKKEKIKGKLIG